MKKITLLLLCILSLYSLNAQTISYTSDSEDYADWGVFDQDGDTFTWGLYNGASTLGFVDDGSLFGSRSWSPTPAPNGTPLTPDNLLFSPVFNISVTALSISFKMKVAATDSGFFAETFAVYVYDDDDTTLEDFKIHEETLTEGGAGTAKDITATIPVSYAGKNVGFYVRHYNTTDQNLLLVDDFEVSYLTVLSIEENQLDNIKIVSSNKNIKLYNLTENTDYKLFSITGQSILAGITNGSTYKIEANSLATGIYILELNDVNTNAVIRKKITL